MRFNSTTSTDINLVLSNNQEAKDRLFDELMAAENKANGNGRAKTRTVSVVYHSVVEAVFNTAQGVIVDDGGGVCNSYKYSTDTSTFSCAWFTDENGVKYVRLQGARVRAPKGPFGRANVKHFNLTPLQLKKLADNDRDRAVRLWEATA